MKPNLLATTVLALSLAGPAFAQRSLFDQPVQNPAEAPAPAAPAAPAAPPPAAAAPAPAPAAPAAAAPAQAEEPAAAPKPRKAKPRKPKGPVPARSLSVVNETAATLVGLEVSQDGRGAKLKKPLPSGKKTRLSLPAFKACEVSVTSTFEGQAANAPSTVDICKEKVLNFKN